ncbi:uncharacterized protein LOC127552400 [Antechinus flavipes]|uniref:uncharacterized protein LOC127552400 n=1 Tax=Antechinus flavipes TaxID=38775 RepID=UPI0022368C71|nr:uncharacterized protein LOC127552400 [Antechinus flavipes]
MSCCRWIRKNIFGCCCLIFQEKAPSIESLDTVSASDEFDNVIPRFNENYNSGSKTKSESKSSNQFESLELPKNFIVLHDLKKEQKSVTIDSPILSEANISTSSGLGESCQLSPLTTRSLLSTSSLQPLEMDNPTDLDTRNVSSQANCSPKNPKNLTQEIEEYFHAQEAKSEEVSVRPLEEIKEADKENMLMPEEPSHSTEGVAESPDIAVVEEAPPKTQEVVQIAPDHQQEKIPTQSNRDELTKNLSVSTHESIVHHDTRSRSRSWP